MERKMKKEKLLKILIAVGIAAIALSLGVKYFKTFLTETEKQKGDEKRIQDILLLNSELDKFQNANAGFFPVEKNKVYISIPSENENCDDLNLPSLAENWEYRCQTETEFQKIGGNGWIPIDFTKAENNALKELPIDPINSTDNLNYYAFISDIAENKIEWALSATIESKKYMKEKAASDAGIDLFKFEIGNNIQLLQKASGLIGYWNFDDEENNIAKDISGNGNDGKPVNDPEQVFGKSGQAYLFNGKDDYIEIKNSTAIDSSKNITIEAWVKPLDNTQRILGNHNADSSAGWFLWYSSEGEFVFVLSDGMGDIYLKSKPGFETKNWNHIVGQYSDMTKKMKLFVNGVKENEITLLKGVTQSENPLTIGKSISGGDGFFKGTIDEVRIYNRILSEKEIQKEYESTF